MKRLDPFSIFDLGTRLGKLDREFETSPLYAGHLRWHLSNSQERLDKMLKAGGFRAAEAEATDLNNAISEVLEKHLGADIDEDANPEPPVFYPVRRAMQAFWFVFNADCRQLEAYQVEKIAGLDISDLLHCASVRLDPSVRACVPELAATEMDRAGRCLALECDTASGFHSLRAIEVVIDAYVRACGGNKREYRSWYDYLEALKELEEKAAASGQPYPSPRVRAVIDRMRLLDRNPLMHPRVSLDSMAADRLFDLAKLAITEMADDLRSMGPTMVEAKNAKEE